MAETKIPVPAGSTSPGAQAVAAEQRRGSAHDPARPASHGELRETLPRDAFPPEALATPPAGPPHLGGKQVQAIVGPHAGSVLTMPEAEADAAIGAHWAIELRQPPHDPNAEPPHDPLTDEEQQAAVDAANEWAKAQAGDAEPKPVQVSAPPTRGATAKRDEPAARRDMHADTRGGYETKDTSSRR